MEGERTGIGGLTEEGKNGDGGVPAGARNAEGARPGTRRRRLLRSRGIAGARRSELGLRFLGEKSGEGRRYRGEERVTEAAGKQRGVRRRWQRPEWRRKRRVAERERRHGVRGKRMREWRRRPETASFWRSGRARAVARPRGEEELTSGSRSSVAEEAENGGTSSVREGVNSEKARAPQPGW